MRFVYPIVTVALLIALGLTLGFASTFSFVMPMTSNTVSGSPTAVSDGFEEVQ